MTQEEIRNRVNQLSTMEDMLNLLNELKFQSQGHQLHPFTMKQLEYYSYSRNIKRSYHYFKIQKKTKKDGKTQYREIRAPKGPLKWILIYLNEILQAMYAAPTCVTGFCPGKSIADNAALHVGKNYVFNIDLKDFFTSVRQVMVWHKLHSAPFYFKDYKRKDGKVIKRLQFANFIANICCYPGIIEEGKRNGYLPQGAPTSPILTNIICERLDYQLSGLAKRFGVTYSRYADDITFSSNHNVYQRDGEFQKELCLIITSNGFEINEKKTRLLRNNMRQEVTGLIVNEKANVTKKYIFEIRRLLHIWKTKGYNEAFSDFYVSYKRERGHVKKGEPCMENVISGKLDFLKMVKGEDNSTYRTLKSLFDKLCMAQEELGKDNIGSDLTYLATYKCCDFNKLFQTRLAISTDKNGKPYAYFMAEGKKRLVSISNNIPSINDDILESLYISYCKPSKGERFYLIHKHIDKDKLKDKMDDELEDTIHNLADVLKQFITDE